MISAFAGASVDRLSYFRVWRPILIMWGFYGCFVQEQFL